MTKNEFWNVVTHGIGALLSVAGLVLMVVFSYINGEGIHLASSIVFGVSMIILYTASTLYHAVQRGKWKIIFKKIDHLSIYLLIAGTYTPFALLGLKGVWGWSIFGIIWGLVVVGFIFKLSPFHNNEKVSVALYVSMGWLIVVAVKPMISNMPTAALLLIVAGGLSYTVGVYFYLKENIPYNHAIWHLFVLGGTLFHFFAVFNFLIL